jgi:chitin disaccharide deacetylase
MADRRLVVNANEFGRSVGINRGIIEAHERGIVSSASLMVRWPAVQEAAAYARGRSSLSVGLHVDLGEWSCRDGFWRRLYAVAPLHDPAAVEAEVDRQLARFRDVIGHDPTHIDSHQHVHGREPVCSVLAALAEKLEVPLRGANRYVRYSDAFHGRTINGTPFPEAITTTTLLRILTSLPPGVTELSCHPGYADDVEAAYREERADEVAVLCDATVRSALPRLGIELTTFSRLSPMFATNGRRHAV